MVTIDSSLLFAGHLIVGMKCDHLKRPLFHYHLHPSRTDHVTVIIEASYDVKRAPKKESAKPLMVKSGVLLNIRNGIFK